MYVVAEVVGADRAASTLERAMSPAAKTELMRRLGIRVQLQTQRRVKTEKTDPDGRKWAANAISTIAAKGHGRVLERSGQLASAFKVDANQSLTRITSMAPHGQFHQHPTFNKRSGRMLPQRAFMGVSDRNEIELRKLLVERLGVMFGGGG